MLTIGINYTQMRDSLACIVHDGNVLRSVAAEPTPAAPIIEQRQAASSAELERTR